jgi:hypothetical protein
MIEYINSTITDQVGLYFFDIKVLKKIKKSTFIERIGFMKSTPIGTKNAIRDNYFYFEEYVPEQKIDRYRPKEYRDLCVGYEWDLEEKFSFEDKIIDLDDRLKYLKSIPFLDFDVQTYQIQFQAKWYGVALSEKYLILF